jgi:hypothetical protein
MPSTYSPLLRLELMAVGEKTNTWGNITNSNLGTFLEKSVAGATTVDVTTADVTLTSLNGSDDQARSAILLVTGTPGVSRNVVAPSISKLYAVLNSSNAVTVLKGAATAGVSLLAGEYALVMWNGADFERVGVKPVSPAFVGTPTAPTAAVDTNSTQLATTSYVINQGYAKTAAVAAAYAPLNGVGTSGTWPISTTGTAGDAGYAARMYGYATTSDLNTTPLAAFGNVYFQPYDSAATNKPVSADNANGLLTLVSYPDGGSGSYGKQLAFANNDDLYARSFAAGLFGGWYKFLHSGNYNGYSPTLTGTGASGTWGINISGTAASVANVTSGTYVPVASNLNNTTGPTMATVFWTRINNTMTVTGGMYATQGSNSAQSSFTMTLPVASALAAEGDLSGTVTAIGGGGRIYASASTDQALVAFQNSNPALSSYFYGFTFSYNVV